MLRSGVLQLKAEIRRFRLKHDGHASALQRSIPVHGKFGSFHHGRSNSKRKGQTSFHSLQRGKSPVGSCASRGAEARWPGTPAYRDLAEQELGGVRKAWSAKDEFCVYRLRQRGPGNVPHLARSAHDRTLGRS